MSRDAHLTLRISSETKKALEALAAAQDTSTGHLVRKAVDQLLGDRMQERVRVYSVRPAGEIPPRRDREWAWLETHRAELEALGGAYIVVEGDRLVAHGPDLPAVVGEARRLGVTAPFLQWVPPRNPNVSWMGL